MILQRIAHHPTTPGLLLIASGAIAMLLSNSILAPTYFALINSTEPINVLFLVNDILMVIFFLEIGLEIKHQVVIGHLSTIKQAALPIFAALGGVILPALIFSWLNHKDPLSMRGWAIPTATDIAFSLGVLILLGKRIPIELRVLLLAIAVIDDLMAIIIIAVFYSHEISPVFLGLSVITVGILCMLNYLKVKNVTHYLILGAILWYCMLKAGLHPTLSGVITALTIPLSPKNNFNKHLTFWVTFIILPLFALTNAGISLQGVSFTGILEPVPLGITLGLIIGKQLGIFSFSWLSVWTKIAVKPQEITWANLYGMALLCGIGFTMSVFIAHLSYVGTNETLLQLSKLGIICGSIVSAILGYCLLFSINRMPKN